MASIDFGSSTPEGEVLFASVSQADMLGECPLEATNADLSQILERMVTQAKSAVQRVSDAHQSSCASLSSQLDDSQEQVQDALRATMVSGLQISSDADQTRINEATRQATAINQLIVTTNSLVSNQCIRDLDDRVLIQQLTGQAISIGGVILGGWPGIATAAGGQLIGRIPLFRSEIDNAVRSFREYEERTSRASFLCLFRLMKETSCLLFADPTETILQGFDTRFESGSGRTTRRSIGEIESRFPHLLAWVGFFRAAHAAFPSVTDFPSIVSFCRDLRVLIGRTSGNHNLTNVTLPDEVIAARSALEASCHALQEYRYPAAAEVSTFNDGFVRNLRVIHEYFEAERWGSSTFGQAAQTHESLLFLQRMRVRMRNYREPTEGVQSRIAYWQLTQRLGETLGRESFRELLQHNLDIVTDSGQRRNPYASDPLRLDAARAAIAVCKTLDPTLVCLQAGNPFEDPSFTEWRRRCVGMGSTLCEAMRDGDGLYLLRNSPEERAYLRSVCPSLY